MLSGNVHKIVVLGIVLIFATVGAQAQQKVYKWVDEDGVVHFSDAPPDESTDTETITTAPAPPPPDRPAPTASQSKQGPFAEDSTSKDTESLPAASAPFAVAEEDISTMSLAALDQRCEVAR